MSRLKRGPFIGIIAATAVAVYASAIVMVRIGPLGRGDPFAGVTMPGPVKVERDRWELSDGSVVTIEPAGGACAVRRDGRLEGYIICCGDTLEIGEGETFEEATHRYAAEEHETPEWHAIPLGVFVEGYLPHYTDDRAEAIAWVLFSEEKSRLEGDE